MTDDAMQPVQDIIYGQEQAEQMHKAPGLARIRDALAQSTCRVLDQVVWKRTELGPLLDLLTAGRLPQRVYLDVPIAAVVSLTHRNFSAATTWRGMLQDLHGFGWDERVIDYSESEIGHQPFPAPAATYELRLEASGGAVSCANGVHRLVAAVNWLGATQGDHAILRKVSVRYSPADHGMVGMLRELQKLGARLHIGGVDDHAGRCMWFIQVATERRTTYFHITPGRCTPIKVGPRLVAKARAMAGLSADAAHFVKDWILIPPAILDATANDAWIDTQISAPRYGDHPD